MWVVAGITSVSIRHFGLHSSIHSFYLETLRILEEVDQWQAEIKAIGVQLCEEKVALNENHSEQLQSLLDARRLLIESVPEYWFRVLMNHAQVSARQSGSSV